MSIPSDNKNQINRTRPEPDPAAFSPKPELDEKRNGGLRGDDKRQGALVDASPQGESRDVAHGEQRNVTLGEQRTAHHAEQQGADVRAPLVKAVDTLPEGLRRERTHPLSPTEGRGGVSSQVKPLADE